MINNGEKYERTFRGVDVLSFVYASCCRNRSGSPLQFGQSRLASVAFDRTVLHS
uniref:Uncharacterized protein n=1 Tax=Kalanchoe fedtschenkoi TaxID=63787 RepID=A0A7N0VN88_KALFE